MRFPRHVSGSQNNSEHFEWSLLDVSEPDESVLDTKFEKENHAEEAAIRNGPENVVLMLANNSAVDHIDDVHQHEGVEAQGILSQSIGWLITLSKLLCDDVETIVPVHGLAGEHKDNHHSNLVSNLRQDVSPHDWLDQFLFSANSLKCVFGFLWYEWLSTDGSGSEDVHDEVHPQELDNAEWWLTN